MTQLTFERLATQLPAGSIEFVGNNQVKINCSILTGDNINLSSSIVEALAKLLRGAATLNDEINNERQQQGKQPINFVEQTINAYGDSQNQSTLMSFTCSIQVNTGSYIENLIDPSSDDTQTN
ncbi:hypothetical protein CAL7716_023770 [Calothrix sp. PCC 7716]|nr:hypothetical protein CAL7716_023770 [Calothrix sp. PCC 7716]